MASGNRSIHLVPSQEPFPKHQPLDARAIVTEMLVAVRECAGALYELQLHEEHYLSQVQAQLDALETLAIRVLASQKEGRS